jgi:hypothetical protein
MVAFGALLEAAKFEEWKEVSASRLSATFARLAQGGRGVSARGARASRARTAMMRNREPVPAPARRQRGFAFLWDESSRALRPCRNVTAQTIGLRQLRAAEEGPRDAVTETPFSQCPLNARSFRVRGISTLRRFEPYRSVLSSTFEQRLDLEIEKSTLFAMGRVGKIADALREGSSGDAAAARRALVTLLATLKFVELNLVAVRKIVKKRDKCAARLGWTAKSTATSIGARAMSNLLSAERSKHLKGLESFEPAFGALLESARAIRGRKACFTPVSNERASAQGTSTFGQLIATGDAADSRALACVLCPVLCVLLSGGVGR